MPTRRKGESAKAFVSRCIPILIKEGRTPQQAAAICHSMAGTSKPKRKKKKARRS